MANELEVNNIVTVTMEGSYLMGQQGEVVEIVEDGDEDGPVGVLFYPVQLFHHTSRREERIVRFQRDELRIDPHWSAKSRAWQLFPNSYHSTVSLKFPFSTRNSCMYEGCEHPVARRVVVNIWGTVIERDVCQQHSYWEGKCAESFPAKKNWQPVESLNETSL